VEHRRSPVFNHGARRLWRLTGHAAFKRTIATKAVMKDTSSIFVSGSGETAGGKSGVGLPERFHWLDFLRFLAALSVVMFHYPLLFTDGMVLLMPRDEMVSAFPHPAVGFFHHYGQLAVPFFWVLSGFVFAHVYFRKPADGYSFAVARFARLYPLHFATLIMVAALQIISVKLTGSEQIIGNNDLRHFVLQIFMVSAWGFEDGQSFNTPIWSVSAEVAVYIIFCMLHRDRWFRTIGGQALCATIAVTIAAAYPSFGAITTCAAFFFAGSFTYLLVANRRRRDFALAGALAVAGILLIPETSLWGVPLVAAIIGFSAVVFAVAWLDIAGLPGGRILGALGDITYSIYLIHMPVTIALLIALRALGYDDRWFLSSPLVLLAYLAVIVAISVPCYRYFERPADRWLRRQLLVRPGLVAGSKPQIRRTAAAEPPVTNS
jgi:peptidoglycan/LPS O-acetylase OafA/YrhL